MTSVASAGARTQAAFCATLVDEWVRGGVTDAVVCPGSRSTPLVLALAARHELRLHVRLDERSAGFFAVGLALASGRPPALCTTSGTAAAELHASVVEAHHARVPLLVCTADRPPELHDVGAPQTIDQLRLYGSAARWQGQPGVPDERGRGAWRALGARALAEATAGPLGPGPVHLNLAFAEPLVAEPGPLPPGRAGGEPWHRAVPPDEAPDPAAAVGAWAGRRGIVVVGGGGGAPDGVLALADALGWPLLADPRSRCRRRRPGVVGSADALLRDEVVRRALRPEVVLALGAPWASKVLGGFVAEAAAAGAEVAAVDPWWRWGDPEHVVARTWRSDPGRWSQAARAALGPGTRALPDAWREAWTAAEAAAQAAIETTLAGAAAARGGSLTEPDLARRLLGLVPTGTRVVVGSSMPVRDLEWFAPPLDDPPEVLANRGANGIDGVCSTALGVAAGGDPVVALVGDLTFLHDVSALVAGDGTSPGSGSCTLVVADNHGGGIFSFLPQAGALAPARFEALFGTPQRPAVAGVAGGFGLAVVEAADAGALAAALRPSPWDPGLRVVRVPVPDRRENVGVHDRLHEAVARAARAALG